MFSRNFLSLALLSATVSADFLIFATTSNQYDGSSASGFNFLNHPPSCDDIGNSINIITYDNDASKGGAACDGEGYGCTSAENIRDWDITRFEFYDGPDAIGGGTDDPESLTSGGLGHISMCPNL